MNSARVARGLKPATFNCIGLRSKVQVGKTERNRANILCSLMESMNIEIVAMQEPHFQLLDDICFLDLVLEKRDYH